MMYKKVTKLGFKSVAHYLLQTAADSEKEGTKVPVSAKRSLAFSTSEATSMLMESADSTGNLKESVELKMNENHKGDGSTPETKDQEPLVPEPKDKCQQGKNNIDGNVDTETKEGFAKISADVVANKDIVQCMENEQCNSIVVDQNNTSSKRKTPIRSEPMPDSIGARLRAAKIGADVVTNKEDSVQYMENKHCDSSVAKKNTAASKRKPSEPMPDSIGARLRARRRICSQ